MLSWPAEEAYGRAAKGRRLEGGGSLPDTLGLSRRQHIAILVREDGLRLAAASGGRLPLVPAPGSLLLCSTTAFGTSHYRDVKGFRVLKAATRKAVMHEQPLQDAGVCEDVLRAKGLERGVGRREGAEVGWGDGGGRCSRYCGRRGEREEAGKETERGDMKTSKGQPDRREG